MIHHPRRSGVGVVVILAIATLIATQPLGVFWHFVEDHMAERSHGAETSVVIHIDDAQSDHDADHGHVWMMPAAAVIAPQVGGPHTIAALGIVEEPAHPSRAPLPPFAPPRT